MPETELLVLSIPEFFLSLLWCPLIPVEPDYPGTPLEDDPGTAFEAPERWWCSPDGGILLLLPDDDGAGPIASMAFVLDELAFCY